jgi:multicomponent Na+:H+ antiporter subunit E
VLRRISAGWALALAGFWWVLAGPAPGAWWVGIVAVGSGVFLHTALGGRQPGRLRFPAIPAFVSWFLLEAVRGGVDVARRSMAPSLPLAPGFLRYRIRLPDGPARVFFVNCISLLPGTFSADLEGDALRVHVLADAASGPSRLEALERKVGRLFGVDPDARGTPPSRVPHG